MRIIRSEWSDVLLICGKCTRKVGGGFGKKGRTPLARFLRKSLGLKKGRKAQAGIVETGCLGLCPKGAVVVIDGHRTEQWMVIRAGAAEGEIVKILPEFVTKAG